MNRESCITDVIELVDRMQHVFRWAGTSTGHDTVAQHTLRGAFWISLLMDDEIRSCMSVSPDKVFTTWIYHDLFETISGDIPYVFKKANPDLESILLRLEDEFNKSLPVNLDYSDELEELVSIIDGIDVLWEAHRDRDKINPNILESAFKIIQSRFSTLAKNTEYDSVKLLVAKAKSEINSWRQEV